MQRRVALGMVGFFSFAALAAAVVSCGEDTPPIGDDGDSPPVIVNPNGRDTGAECNSGNDCKSGNCSNAKCTAPKPVGTDDTNGGTGGGTEPECTTHDQCKTACRDDHVCASAPSCTRQHGGRSCGPNGDEDCCAKVKQGSYTLDKYLITAGRMRAFIEREGGDIQGYVAKLPANQWDTSWTDPDALPTNIETANAVMGAALKRACSPGSNTGRTYWTPKSGDDYSDFDQDVLDEKALNCVPWQMVKAFCVFDGGHLATVDELRAAFTNGGTTKYPWGDDYYDPSGPDPQNRLNAWFNYSGTPLPNDYRKDDDGNPKDNAFYVSPPGRFPLGDNKAGVADAAGDLLEWVGEQPRRFVWKADFEKHGSDAKKFNATSIGGSNADIWSDTAPIYAGGGPWIWGNNQLGLIGTQDERNGYYSIGARCAY